MSEVILTHEDMKWLLWLVNEYNEHSDKPRHLEIDALYEKLLDICELEDE